MSEIVHILNGDSLSEIFPDSIVGEKIIFREMMMEGPVQGDNLLSLIEYRMQYFLEAYRVPNGQYKSLTVSEFHKMVNINTEATVYLWFEYDLFCQINMWCAIHLLTKWNDVTDIRVVYPGHDDWMGFARSDQHLLSNQYVHAITISAEDVSMIHRLWDAYRNKNWDFMESLKSYSSTAFPRQSEIIQLQLDRIPKYGKEGKIHSTINNLVAKYGKEDFGRIFQTFSKEMGQYGMGDMQVKRIVDML